MSYMYFIFESILSEFLFLIFLENKRVSEKHNINLLYSTYT